jgi:butirosin biosynthesis protein H-like/uncharacterized protein DUF4872
MPRDKDFKRLVRARMGRTGESYTAARAHLRPNDGQDGPDRLRGRHPDTAALARLLTALGVTDPASGQPLSEATVFGVAGGIGVAYFVFEYADLTSFYLGGRINPHVQKADATQAALARLGVPAEARRTTSPAAAERQLRAALDQGRPVVATVDVASLRYRAVPPELRGMTPMTCWSSFGEPTRCCGTWPWCRFRSPGLSWPRPGGCPLGQAPAGRGRGPGRSGGPGRGGRGRDRRPLGRDVRAADAQLRPARAGQVGRPAHRSRDPKGWPRLLAGPGRQFHFLAWLFDWVETAGTGGGFFRGMYAEFLEAAARPLDRPELAALAGNYRKLAAAWTELARVAVAGGGSLTRAGELLGEKRRLLEHRGGDAADELAAIQAELRDLAGGAEDPQPLAAAALHALLADLGERTLGLAEAEEAAAAALRAAVPRAG